MSGLHGRVDPSVDAWSANRVRVLVDSNFPGQPYRVFVQRMDADGRLSDAWIGPEPSEVIPDDVTTRPFVLDVPDDIARAVYEALRDRYEPELVDAQRLNRADYDAERARVDRLLDVVSRVALDGGTE